MTHKFMKMAGCKSPEEFYSKYPDEETFFNSFPKARKMANGGTMKVSYDYNGINVNNTPQVNTADMIPEVSSKPKITKSLSYQKWTGADEAPIFVPQFNGTWSKNDKAQMWSSIPEKFGNVPVLRGDAFDNFNPQHYTPTTKDWDTRAAHSMPYRPINQSVAGVFAEGGTIPDDPNVAQAGASSGGGGGSFGGTIKLSTLGLIQGADALATMAYNSHIKKSEAQMMRNQLMPVTSPLNFNGLSTDVVSMGLGGMSYPNALVEGGEVIQTPDGVTQDIYGQKHNDRADGMGGTEMNLPDNSRVYSDQIKLDKDVSSDIVGRKITKKMTPANLAKKYDTEKYEKVLLDKNSDSLAKRTASIMKEHNQVKLDHIFDMQEQMKGNPPMGSQQMFAEGGMIKKYAPGGEIESDYPDPAVALRMKYGQDTLPNLNPTPDRLLNTDYGVPSLNTPSRSEARSNSPSFGKKLLGGLGKLGEFAPEGFAALSALTRTPVNTAKFQPKYLGEVPGLDISAQLGHNYSQVKGMMNSTGNASIDAARNAQLVANLSDANNEVYSKKYEFDNNQRYQREAYNNQVENNSNQTNLQRADQAWDKMTQRKSNQDASLQGVMNSAYAKTKAMQMEQNSLRVAQQLYPNYRYNPDQYSSAMQFVPGPNGQIFAVLGGYGMGIRQGDGMRTTITTDNKGKKTVRSREDDGA